jgi:hypothetical protein
LRHGNERLTALAELILRQQGWLADELPASPQWQSVRSIAANRQPRAAIPVVAFIPSHEFGDLLRNEDRANNAELSSGKELTGTMTCGFGCGSKKQPVNHNPTR